MNSLAFDRAVAYYDRTRAIPRSVQEKITDSLIQQVGGDRGAGFLEVGIGTGRISRPLLERGYRVVGIDLSLAMMREM